MSSKHSSLLSERPWSFCKTCVAMKFVDDDDDDDELTISNQLMLKFKKKSF